MPLSCQACVPQERASFWRRDPTAPVSSGGSQIPRTVLTHGMDSHPGPSSATIVRRTLFGLSCVFQYGRTPLHLAANNGILDVVRYLCLAGANVEALTSVSHPLGQENAIESRRKLLRPQGHEEQDITWQLPLSGQAARSCVPA